MNKKLLVAIIMIDVSLGLRNKQNVEEANRCYSRIVTNLENMQKEHSELEVKIATMLIGSRVRWHLEPTDIEKCKMEFFEMEEATADFRGAFLELQDKLSRRQYMAHSGKIAAPFIALITGGTCFSKFDEEIKMLHNNGWFCNASRAVGIIGRSLTDFDREDCKPFVGDIENIFQRESEIQEFRVITLGPGTGRKYDSEPPKVQETDESSFLLDDLFGGTYDEKSWTNIFDDDKNMWQ